MLEVIAAFLFWLVMAGASALMLLAYFLPTIIVLVRRNQGMATVVIVLNLLLGWTFLGWVISLVLSLVTFSSSHQHYYCAYPQPSAYPLIPAAGGYQQTESSLTGTPVANASVTQPGGIS